MVTNYFSRDENPLKRLYLQQKAKAETVQIQNKRAEEIERAILEEEISSEIEENVEE